MALTRLTNNIREALLKQLLARGFETRINTQLAAVALLADEVYKDVYGADLDRINRLPSGWLPKVNRISVVLSGNVQPLGFGGQLDGYQVPEEYRACGVRRDKPTERRVPSKDQGMYQPLKQYDYQHPFSTRLELIKTEEAALKAEINATRRTTRTALEGVNTVQKLIQVWPEVEAFAAPFIVQGEQRAVLPAVPRERLNVALGLPAAVEEVPE